MRYRLVELLHCVRCRGELTLAVAQATPSLCRTAFTCRRFCPKDRRPIESSGAACDGCGTTEIMAGTLTCKDCGRTYPVVEGIPWLLEQPADEGAASAPNTVAVYSHLWRNLSPASSPGPNHLDPMEEALGEPVVQGTLGLDAGSGCGADTARMASRHPEAEIVSLDLSEGVYETRGRTADLSNVHVVRGSVLAVPLRAGLCDFVYSFGVLHHTPDPKGGMKELARMLKPGGRVTLYLYEDHGDNLWKALPLRAVTLVRHVTTRLPARLLSALCYLVSPLVVLLFSIPARVLGRFKATKAIADQMPFNFGGSLFSVHGDLLDRFGAQIEERYSKEDVAALLEGSGLRQTRTTKLKATAGWVAQAAKPESLLVGENVLPNRREPAVPSMS